ncbi:shieldin complex subunit 3 [Pelobates fuscus]|uniref:shieldin complex subunit 3 n=1 Tax=Pelobates fuscus TaxID=191477 RepID=UPI002FE4C457
MEVIVHYRPSINQKEVIQKIADAALEQFPVRTLPTFSPWFPCNSPSFALKPQINPPLISQEDAKYINPCTVNTENVGRCKGYDCTMDLLEFKPSTKNEGDQHSKKIINYENTFIEGQAAEPGKTMLRRSWSLCTSRCNWPETIIPLSEELKNHLNTLLLNPFHRGWWSIEPSMCGGLNLEEVWMKLNRINKHHYLPSCNATLRRDLPEIWVFCDLQYCEHTGTFLKEKLKLTGKMKLYVRKHGIILHL